MEAGQLFIIFGLLFFAVLVYVGFLTRKWIHDASDFILAGREVSTALNIFGVASISFAGTSRCLDLSSLWVLAYFLIDFLYWRVSLIRGSFLQHSSVAVGLRLCRNGLRCVTTVTFA